MCLFAPISLVKTAMCIQKVLVCQCSAWQHYCITPAFIPTQQKNAANQDRLITWLKRILVQGSLCWFGSGLVCGPAKPCCSPTKMSF